MALRISSASQAPAAAPQQALSSPVTGAFQQRLQQRQAVGGSTANVPTDAHAQALDLLAMQQASNMQYLKLQSDLANPKHSVISNVLKVRHDTVKNSIANIR